MFLARGGEGSNFSPELKRQRVILVGGALLPGWNDRGGGARNLCQEKMEMRRILFLSEKNEGRRLFAPDKWREWLNNIDTSMLLLMTELASAHLRNRTRFIGVLTCPCISSWNFVYVMVKVSCGLYMCILLTGHSACFTPGVRTQSLTNRSWDVA